MTGRVKYRVRKISLCVRRERGSAVGPKMTQRWDLKAEIGRSRLMYRIHSDADVADSTAVKLQDSGVEWKRFG